MKRRAVVAIHGIGTGTGFSRSGFSDALKRNVFACLHPEKIHSQVWRECIWEDLNEELDVAVRGIVRNLTKGPLLSGLSSGTGKPRRFLRILKDVTFPALGWLAEQILDLGLDYAWYLDSCHGERIRERLRTVIRETAEQNDAEIVLAAHSLGSVIAYDVLAQVQAGRQPSLPVVGLITFGSPLEWTFDIRKADGRPECRFGSIGKITWNNFYYPEDYVALYKGLSGGRFKGMARDFELKKPSKTSAITSHCAYWEDKTLAKEIAEWL